MQERNTSPMVTGNDTIIVIASSIWWTTKNVSVVKSCCTAAISAKLSTTIAHDFKPQTITQNFKIFGYCYVFSNTVNAAWSNSERL